MGEAHFRTPTPPKPLNQFRCHVKYITMSPRELMCKIWLESIQPLRICACVKKHVLCGFFLINISVYLSIYLSVRFFVGATGHSFGPILTVNGSNDVLATISAFCGHINIAPY